MTANNACPEDDVLVDLVEGRLTLEVSEQWTLHIGACANCQARLDSNVLSDRLPALKNTRETDANLVHAIAQVKLLRQSRRDFNDRGYAWPTAGSPSFIVDGFELLGMIGRGGMGIVYRARDTSLDRIVAIKTLTPELSSDPAARRRFLREARSAAAIVHPNVITIHSVSEGSLTPYLVMEYVEGASLQRQLDLSGSFNVENVIRIGCQICSALDAAHIRGVIHRDIKPSNILLDAQTGRALLSDFGLAFAANHSRLTRSGTIVGTPAFMAPESIESGNHADARGDLFSLGTVLYAMCNGASPFESETLLGTIHRVASMNPPSLFERHPDFPVWLSDLVTRLLQKNPNDRYDSAREVQRDLEARGVSHFAGHMNAVHDTAEKRAETIPEISLAPTVTTSPRIRRRKKRWSILTYAGAGAAVLVVAGIAAVLSSAMTNSEPVDTQTSTTNAPAIELNIDSELRQDWFSVRDGDDEWEEGFESLDDAIERLTDGGTLLIRTNATLVVDPCLVEFDDVTVRAAPGFTPKLSFVPNPHEEAMLGVEGSLSLVGLELRTAGIEDDETHSMISLYDRGSVTITDCQLVAEDMGYLLSVESGGSVEIIRSRLHANQTTAIGVVDSDGGTISLLDSWITGNNGFALVESSPHAITLQNSQLVCQTGFRLETEEDEFRTQEIIIEDSLIFVTKSMVEAEETDPENASVAGAVKLVGHKNTFAGLGLANRRTQEWQRELQANDSRYVENPLRIDSATLLEKLRSSRVPSFRFDRLSE